MYPRVVAWVLGAGGLLGRNLSSALEARDPVVSVYRPLPAAMPWRDHAGLRVRLALEVDRFAQLVSESDAAWLICWAAGAAVVGSPATELALEEAGFRSMLSALDRAPALVDSRPGLLFLTSSAGGAFGDTPERPITETSACRPVSEYGRAKLRLESLLVEWAGAGRRALIGRVANLYGPGQRLAKPQGFVAQASRCILYNRPIHVYVPLDTVRDYLYAADAADHILDCCLYAIAREESDFPVCKIFASEQPTTLAQILGIFVRITRRRPRVVSAAAPTSPQHPRVLPFRSVVWPWVPRRRRTDLLSGIAQVHHHQAELFRAGRLPPP